MAKQKTSEPNPIPSAASAADKTHVELPKVQIKSNDKKGLQGLPYLNYILMFVGLAVIVLGYILMSGGRSEDPNVFDADALYSFRRITLAPILIIIGLVIEGYAIMRKQSS
jgi:hypothetical protein